MKQYEKGDSWNMEEWLNCGQEDLKERHATEHTGVKGG
jgi:hypothetical protein